MATDFGPADDGKISSYTAVVFFSIGALISTVILNPVFMARPVQGEPVKMQDGSVENKSSSAGHARRRNLVSW